MMQSIFDELLQSDRTNRTMRYHIHMSGQGLIMSIYLLHFSYETIRYPIMNNMNQRDTKVLGCLLNESKLTKCKRCIDRKCISFQAFN